MNTMTLAQVILACSLSSTPHVNNTLHRVVMATSQGHTHWIATPRGHLYTPESVERALAIIEGLPHQELHIGVAALSSSRLRAMDLSAQQALDVCTNVGAASLELERTLGKDSSVQSMHVALATYWNPDAPESLEALSFGARVLAREEVDVEREAMSTTPQPGPTYTFAPGVFDTQGMPKVDQETGLMHDPVVRTGLFGRDGAPETDDVKDVSPDATKAPETQPATEETP